MFASVWGPGYNVVSKFAGRASDEETVTSHVVGWQERLSRQYDEWKATDVGKSRFEQAEAENRRKREEKKKDEEEEDLQTVRNEIETFRE